MLNDEKPVLADGLVWNDKKWRSSIIWALYCTVQLSTLFSFYYMLFMKNCFPFQPVCIIVEDKDDIAKFANYEAPAGDAAPAEAATEPEPVAAPAPPPPPAPTPATPPPPPPAAVDAPPPVLAGSRIMASPMAKALAARKGIDLSVSGISRSYSLFHYISPIV